jgi:putative lipoprotein
MSHTIDRRLFLSALIALPALSRVARAADTRIEGEVFYRPRIALPDDATLVVRLLDAADKAVTTFTKTPAGQVPIPFVLEAGETGEGLHRIEAFIAVAGDVRFATEEPVPVEGNGPFSVEVSMRSGSMAPGTPTLTRTEWVLDSMGGRVLIAGTEISLSINDASEVSGFAGCNWYFGAAILDDGGKIFIQAGTSTYAGDFIEGALQQEFDYLQALSLISAYRIEQRRLVLTDPSGTDALIFRPRR